MMKVEMTSSAFLRGDWKQNLLECRRTAESFGWEFGVQIHNTAPLEQLETLSRQKICLSAHSPFNQKYNWNLASMGDVSETFHRIDENLSLYRRYGIFRTVFHAGVMSDVCPEAFGHGKSYFECMKSLIRKELSWSADGYFNRDFRDVPEFSVRLQHLKENLAQLRKRYPDFVIAVENDFPACSSMNMAIDTLLELEHPFCLDTGHLWASSHFFDWNFQEEIAKAARSGNLVMSHFHASVYDSSYPREKWSDGHQPLATPNSEMNLPRAACTLYRGGACSLGAGNRQGNGGGFAVAPRLAGKFRGSGLTDATSRGMVIVLNRRIQFHEPQISEIRFFAFDSIGCRGFPARGLV